MQLGIVAEFDKLREIQTIERETFGCRTRLFRQHLFTKIQGSDTQGCAGEEAEQIPADGQGKARQSKLIYEGVRDLGCHERPATKKRMIGRELGIHREIRIEYILIHI